MSQSEADYKFAACTYFAKNHPGETCGSNGLPLTPSSVTILGRAQCLLSIDHPNLCTYLDVIRGKHERIIVVAEILGTSLRESQSKFSYLEIASIAYQVAMGMQHLHDKNIMHGTLADDNIFVDHNGRVKLFNYGLHYMTNGGSEVSFPLGLPKFLSPEVILKGGGPAADVWTYGLILLELCIGKLWANLKPAPILRRILTLAQTSNPAERIAREHDCLEKYKEVPEELRKIIEKCLQIYPRDRVTFSELVTILSGMKRKEVTEVKPHQGLLGLKLQFLYHLWQLMGGDVQAELKTHGLIKSCPPILSMPIAIILDGCIVGGKTGALYDRRLAKYGFGLLKHRLSHIPLQDYYPLMHETRKQNDSVTLPKIIRERDTEYQFYRLIWFQRLLQGYPHTAALVAAEARADVPPLLRGAVWAALLRTRTSPRAYLRIDKETPTPTDRQIDVDIPRCHQYCWLLSGARGHGSLRRLLKAWLLTHPRYVYWQGLDSLTAPFLYLNFCDEARAFACLSAFVPRFVHNFFLKDNSAVIREYLAKFRQLTAFYQPRLASHLHDINFVPELFAIPWFLTMFSHVFPLHKIVHLWDALLVEGAGLAALLGAALLLQLRDALLAAGFNECILLFSDLPDIDIEECVKRAVEMSRNTPKSICYRRFTNEPKITDPMDAVEVDLEVLYAEMSPRISLADCAALLHRGQAFVIDIRSNLLFEKQRIAGSASAPYSSVQLAAGAAASLRGGVLAALQAAARAGRVVVVAAGHDDTPRLFSEYLVKCGIPKVCILHGGVPALLAHMPSLFTAPPTNKTAPKL